MRESARYGSRIIFYHMVAESVQLEKVDRISFSVNML